MSNNPVPPGDRIDRMLADAADRLSEPFGHKLFASDLEWYAFPQTWGSTALGFGGIGGQMMTTAQTYVVMFGGMAVVYFGGRFAYLVRRPNENFFACLRNWRMPSVRERGTLEDKPAAAP